jgi:hypothetical protein
MVERSLHRQGILGRQSPKGKPGADDEPPRSGNGDGMEDERRLLTSTAQAAKLVLKKVIIFL